MSRLSDILGVKEGQEFRFGGLGIVDTYKINGDRRMYKSTDGEWYETTNEYTLSQMIAHPELIQTLPEKLTEQQITAIKGRIAEGTPWAARDGEGGTLCFYKDKPKRSHNPLGYFYLDDGVGYESKSELYDFITFENSPVYLPELIDRSEE